MKQLSLLAGLLVLLVSITDAQTPSFPKSWEGNWKGELSWFKTGTATPQKVIMELRIHPTDSAGTWTWQMIYGSESTDNRPYLLIPKDSTGIHWVIDEQNGIILDQYLVDGRFAGAFTVMNATIINNCWMENGKLMIEFYSYGAKPLITTGKGTEESPHVDSYRLGSYQKAILERLR